MMEVEKMKQGDIIFIQGGTFISKIIRYFDDGDFTHVGIALNDSIMIEAEYDKKVSVVNFNKELGEGKIKSYEVIDLKLTKEQRETIYVHAMKFKGVRYDYLQIASFILNKIFGWKVFNSRDKFICSELVFEVLDESNVLKDLGIEYVGEDIAKYTPNELYRFIKGIQNR